MSGTVLSVVLLAALTCPDAVVAQTTQADTRETGVRASTREEGRPDGLPVSLARIRRRLAAPATRESSHGLRLAYYVNVYGRAPRLRLFVEGEKATNAPVLYGGMTHQEFLRVVRPKWLSGPR